MHIKARHALDAALATTEINELRRHAETAEASVATLTARVAKLEALMRRLIDCGNAAVGADPRDLEAQEAFDMWSDARRTARALLQKDKNHE